jgi:hypothetical protein
MVSLHLNPDVGFVNRFGMAYGLAELRSRAGDPAWLDGLMAPLREAPYISAHQTIQTAYPALEDGSPALAYLLLMRGMMRQESAASWEKDVPIARHMISRTPAVALQKLGLESLPKSAAELAEKLGLMDELPAMQAIDRALNSPGHPLAGNWQMPFGWLEARHRGVPLDLPVEAQIAKGLEHIRQGLERETTARLAAYAGFSPEHLAGQLRAMVQEVSEAPRLGFPDAAARLGLKMGIALGDDIRRLFTPDWLSADELADRQILGFARGHAHPTRPYMLLTTRTLAPGHEPPLDVEALRGTVVVEIFHSIERHARVAEEDGHLVAPREWAKPERLHAWNAVLPSHVPALKEALQRTDEASLVALEGALDHQLKLSSTYTAKALGALREEQPEIRARLAQKILADAENILNLQESYADREDTQRGTEVLARLHRRMQSSSIYPGTPDYAPFIRTLLPELTAWYEQTLLPAMDKVEQPKADQSLATVAEAHYPLLEEQRLAIRDAVKDWLGKSFGAVPG